MTYLQRSRCRIRPKSDTTLLHLRYFSGDGGKGGGGEGKVCGGRHLHLCLARVAKAQSEVGRRARGKMVFSLGGVLMPSRWLPQGRWKASIVGGRGLRGQSH
jgi:hypothetical protein